MGKRFCITYTIDAVLHQDDIWPDGDAPEHPTADDVRALLERGPVIVNLRDWNLDNDGDLWVVEATERK